MSGLYRVQPLADYSIFTTPPSERKEPQFKAPWSRTVADLRRELGYLDAHDAVLELAVQPRHIRVDGELRSDVPKDLPHPGVRLSFLSKHGQLSRTCDTYESKYYGRMADWQANLRAIVLTLEAARAMDRYGASNGDQYVGFRALGAGSGATAMGASPAMTRDVAIALIREHSGAHESSTIERHFRLARRAAHPDTTGGDRTVWDQLEAAGKVLGLA